MIYQSLSVIQQGGGGGRSSGPPGQYGTDLPRETIEPLSNCFSTKVCLGVDD